METIVMDDPFPQGLLEDWREFLEQSEYGTAMTSVFDRPLAFPLQRRRESALMMQIAAAVNPRRIMEIGADKGGSVYLWATAFPGSRVLACEVRGCPYGRLFEEHLGSAPFNHNSFLWLPFGSENRECQAMVERDCAKHGPLDVLFIDGDKAWFLRDFDLYAKHVRKGGLVILHDVTDPAPNEACFALQQRKVPMVARVEDRYESLMLGDPRTAHDHWLKQWNGRSCGFAAFLA